MKILLISSGTEGKDGWSVYTRTLTDGLQQAGHDNYHAENLGTPLSYFTNPLFAFLNAGKLRKQIKKINPDIIHITVEPYSAMLPRLGKKIAAKTVLTIHGSYGVRMLQGSVNKKRSCWVLQHVGKCIVVSEYTKKRVTDEVRLQCGDIVAKQFSENVEVIKNGVEPPAAIAYSENTVKQILCVGGVKPRKGILESLKALAQYIKTTDKNVHMTIVGSYKKNDAYMQSIQNFVYGQSLSECVTFTGTLSDEELQKIYTQTDLYLMPAKTTPDTFEGFGIVFIEAAGYGIPCIGTNDSGAAEAIDEGVSGYKCNPNDIDALVKAMENILNEEKIDRTACRNWAEKHTADAMVSAIESLYRTLV
jgi:glycosyltransferase involved in cell wall biosynthesis